MLKNLKLYKVIITHEIMVVARDENEAESIGESAVIDEDPDQVYASLYDGTVPHGWEDDCLVYCPTYLDNGARELTLGEAKKI
jgi:hypothetical protein